MDIEVDYCVMACAMVGAHVVNMLHRRSQERRDRRWWMRPWLRRRDNPGQHTMINLHQEFLDDGDLAEFQATLRMSPELYRTLLEILRPSISRRGSNFRQPISAEVRLALTMRYLALGEAFRTLSHEFRVGLSTSREIVVDTCEAIIANMMNQYLKTPSSCQEWEEISQEFYRRWQFPHVIGCVDGKHVRIVQPPGSGSLYYNYKHFFSIVHMAVVGPDYEFLYVYIGCEGRASDGGVWQKTEFQENLDDPHNPLGIPQPATFPGIEGELPYYLVGDAFRLSYNRMKPFSGRGHTRIERLFNYRLSRCRRLVENAFGILAQRFRLLHRAIRIAPERASKVVLAMCILHNFLHKHNRQGYIRPTDVDQEIADGEIVNGTWRENGGLLSLQNMKARNASQYAKSKRNLLADFFVSREGSLPWQYRIVP